MIAEEGSRAVPAAAQRIYLDAGGVSTGRWHNFEAPAYVDDGGGGGGRSRSYTIGSSVDPTIRSLKTADPTDVYSPFPSYNMINRERNGAYHMNGGNANTRSVTPVARPYDHMQQQAFSIAAEMTPEFDATSFLTDESSNRGGCQLLSLISDYRSFLRDFVCEFGKVSLSEDESDVIVRAGWYAKVAHCCATWLEALSRSAAHSMKKGSGNRSDRAQIESLAALIPPAMAEDAIVSLLKTAILQSLLLTRITTSKAPVTTPQQARGSPMMASYTTVAPPQHQPVMPIQHPHFVSPTSMATNGSPNANYLPASLRNSALLQALRESPSDSTITNLLKEVDLQRIAAKFSSLSNLHPEGGAPSTTPTPPPTYPTDVGTLLRSTAALEEVMSPLPSALRNRSYSDLQHDFLGGRSDHCAADAPSLAKRLSSSRKTLQSLMPGSGSGLNTFDDDVIQDDEGADPAASSRTGLPKKRASPVQKEMSPPSTPQISGDLSGSEGVHVPQLDLDAILMPVAATSSTVSSNNAPSGGDSSSHSEWQQRVRQAVRKGTASLLTHGKRLRSQSDLVSRSEMDAKISEDLDLRPAWMRKPRLLDSINTKVEMMVQQKPIFYVEWNILGFLKILNDPSQDRIVSPEYAVSISPDVELPPLRLMVSIHHGAADDSPTSSTSKDCQYGNVRIGVEFTIPADIEVKYHVFHGAFLSEARWHSFKDKPWAGVHAHEAPEPLPHPIGPSVTVGVILLEIRSKGSTGGVHQALQRNHSATQAGSHVSMLVEDKNDGVPSSRHLPWLHGQQSGSTNTLSIPRSGSQQSGCDVIPARPRAYSDWQHLTPPASLHLQPLNPHLRRHPSPPVHQHYPGLTASPVVPAGLPVGLPSVSDLLRLSGVIGPDVLLAGGPPPMQEPSTASTTRMNGGSVQSQRTHGSNPSETPSLLLHESLSRMTLSPNAPFDKQLFAEIWNSAGGPSNGTYDDLVSGCLR
eukprot:Blabericola_migrator_1__13129@NODE_898_length_6146_cov_167_477052_g628_i0_p1_GENE_NODE_898_length_6146_cov_167_477052_g628_i0NODE_898_length_6146_cov_167_477052_g628_i0_p1_ORF_typecomplete_len974_score130_56_NODE_898_length_6146_cov_167_477052_g628_i03263247